MRVIREASFTGECKIYFAHKVKIGQNAYFIIFGRHVNGYFVALPEWGIACNVEYGANLYCEPGNLIAVGVQEDEAKAIAGYISDWLEQNGDCALIEDRRLPAKPFAPEWWQDIDMGEV